MDFPNLSDERFIVTDVETTGVDWRYDRMVGLVVCVGPHKTRSWYWPTRHECGKNFDHDTVMRWYIDKIASREDVHHIGHNFKFDLHMLRNEGVFLKSRNLECTMVNEALIDENAGAYSLDACASRHGVSLKLGTELYTHLANKFGGEPVKSQMGNFWKLPAHDQMANDYARGDGVTTYQLWQSQQREIDKQNLHLVHSVEKRVLRTLHRMERVGVRIDEEQLDKLGTEMQKKLKTYEQQLPKDFNTRSPKQVRQLMEKKGHTDWPKTPKGNPSFPEDWLSSNETGRLIVGQRQASNLISSFVEPLKTRHLYKGRVHTNFNQTKMDDYGVVTGRLSSSGPNLQQVPKRNKVLAPLFRRVFLPEEGHYWSSNDYKQQEFVVFAFFSRSKALMEGYRKTPQIDAHSNVATMMNVERDPTAKRLNLGTVFGMGVPKLALKLGIPIPEARLLYNQYHTNIPEAKIFSRKAEQRAKSRGYVKTLLGRRRHYPDWRMAYQAMNSVVQGSSADITKLKMVEVDEYFELLFNDECRLMLQVHDDLCFSIPNDKSGHAMDKHAQAIMQDFTSENAIIKMDVPLLIDHTEGAHWGEATFGGEE